MGNFREDRVGLTKRERGIPESLVQDFSQRALLAAEVLAEIRSI